MRKGMIPVTLIGLLMAAALTACASEQPPASQDLGDGGAASAQATVETGLDQTDFAFACEATCQVEKDPDTGAYALQEVQTTGFVTTKGEPAYGFFSVDEAETTQQEDGSYLVQQALQMTKNSAEVAVLTLEATFTLDPETGEVTGTASLVEVQNEGETEAAP